MTEKGSTAMQDTTHTTGPVPEYAVSDHSGNLWRSDGGDEARFLQRMMSDAAHDAALMVREVYYGPWYPFGSPAAFAVCPEDSHDSTTACPRCGWDWREREPEPETTDA